MAEAFAVSNENINVPRFLSTLSSLLQHAADCSDAIAADGGRSPPPSDLSAFSSLSKPEISIPCYLERIFRFANCSHSCFVVAYIYLKRFLLLHPSHAIDSLNVHRFLITSVLTALKFWGDRYYNNAFYAKVGGISLDELNFLEVNFLFSLRFRLNVETTIFESYCGIFQREADVVSPQIPPMLRINHEEDESRSRRKLKHLIID